MQSDKKRRFFALTAAAALLLLPLSVLWTRGLFQPSEKNTLPAFAELPRVKILLYEAGTDFPLKGVTVAVPETGERVTVDSGDYLSFDTEKSEVTLLLYKKGYADTAVFHLPIEKKGLKTVRYAMYKAADALPFVVYAETPSDEGVKLLLDRWRK